MKILMVRNDKLGDFITTLPSLYIIKQHLPNCHLAVLISAINESIALECSFIDEIIIDEKQKAHELAKFLKPKKFDLSITLFSNMRVAFAQFLAQIPRRIAPATKIAQIFYTKRIKQRRSEVKMAEFEYNMELVKATFPSISKDYPKPFFIFDLKNQENIYTKFKEKFNIKKPIVAFHPGSGGSSDGNFSIKEYIELAKEVEKIDNYDIIFTFGPEDKAFLDKFKLLKNNLKCKIYESKDLIIDFAKLIATFKLFISTSTGTYHLASAVGCETITFFGDTLFACAKRWKSIGNDNLQHNYMIPLDKDAKKAFFKKMKLKIRNLL